MALSRVDRGYRIVIEKRLRSKVKVHPRDKVFLEPIDENSFRAAVMRPGEDAIKDDPAWRAIHAFVRPKRSVSAEKLHRFMEEEAWEV